ncbi:hypothetical protein KNT12_gp006 [Enterobacteria phage ATK47]|uniref:DUF7418 domain-containing protein n=1 Tax=Enterobacteria phage ATK47 TaxID=1651196 RepID=A0A384T893_9CAUD|nr:hypothetical protein KNT12_gp006 [Enterobacteria phage ATK47]ANZ50954.1 hypothetical protein [Enterobacteria phage ATK47]ANZ51296.1 hypothetical protein [Enterobacteria phage ATK48]
MIHPFDVSESKIANLRGHHKCKSVYCAKLVKHPGDAHYGWLECDEVVNEIPPVDANYLEEGDRIYFGELHIRGIYGKDELGIVETEESSDIYPVE